MPKADALDQLCRLLQARPSPRLDWSAILEVANRALVTPRIEGRLDASEAPDEVRRFVEDVARRNAERNARLFSQMGEAAAALNAAGLVPLVLKGGACLARTGGRCARIINDLDLVVSADEIETALAALRGAGFSLIEQRAGVALHAVAELGRPQDVGLIDLHQRPPGPPGFVSGAEIVCAGKVQWVGPGRLRVPDPHMHIYLQALHDQLHDGGYWRGGFDLRHAWDIADLIEGDEPVDWERLATLPPTRLTAHAVEAQLMACHRLTGAAIPPAYRGWPSRLRYRRQRLQYAAPTLRLALAAAAVASEAPNLLGHHRQDQLGRAQAGLPTTDSDPTLRLSRLHRLLTAEQGGRL